MKNQLLNLTIFATLLHAGQLQAQCPAATPVVNNTSIACGTAATLTATGSTGYQWWDQPSGGTLLASSATYTTPVLTTNTSYYVNGTDVLPQTMMGLPAYSGTFNGSVRGYYFTSPVDFTITGLKIPSDVSGLQNIAVVKLTALPPNYPTVTNSFTTLFLTQNNPSTGIIAANIPVVTGDIIGILGQADWNNSFSPNLINFPTSIAGQPVNIARLGMQFTLDVNPPQNLWTESISNNLSRIEMYYTAPCSSSRAQADVSVVPIPVVATATDTSICAGTGTTLQTSGATTYNWMPGNQPGASLPVSPSATTTYTVTGTNPNGCSNTDSVTVVVNPLPVVNASASTSTACLADGAVTLTGSPANGTWSGTGVTGSSFNPGTAGLGTHTAYYNYTDANGCSGSDSVAITVDVCLGTAAQTLENAIGIFPSPNNGTFTFTAGATLGDVQLMITDVQGRVVYLSNENNVTAGFAKQISLENATAGLYFIHITSKEQQCTKKVAVQQ